MLNRSSTSAYFDSVTSVRHNVRQKTAGVREVQHHLSKVLAWVEKGEEVQITRRSKPVAKIVPAAAQGMLIALPAFAARARQIWGEAPVGKNLSQTVVDDRKERA
jgi:prevent-host-death family protein